MGLPVLGLEICCLLGVDLVKVCKVCKSFDELATALLYRSIIFRRSHETRWVWETVSGDKDVKDQGKREGDDLSARLFYRLLDDRNERLRPLVHELTIEDTGSRNLTTSSLRGIEESDSSLDRLVKELPNLRNIYYRGEFPWETTLADTLLKRSPRLHLLGEEGRTTVSGKMPSVRSLPTWVNAWERRPTGRSSRSSPYVPQKLALRELFSAFPNLEGLSVSVSRLQGGCVISSEPPDTKIHELPDNEAFPPLQSLSLSGYNIQSEEQVWLEKFPWQHLRSLSLGKQNSPGFLEVATGRVQSLTEFRITSYDFRNTEDPQLDTFLSSFHTLESLTAKGTVPSLDTVAHHTNLRHLCLHAIETPKEDRQTLDAKQISDLDWHLPRLRSLEIDLDPDGTWPYECIDAIAMGFRNIRQLYIHVGLGIARLSDGAKPKVDYDFESVLTKPTAEEFARRVFERRSSSVLEAITLKTGESLRWFPRWHPKYARAEKDSQKTVVIYLSLRSGDEPRVNEGESFSERCLRESKAIFPRLLSNRPSRQGPRTAPKA